MPIPYLLGLAAAVSAVLGLRAFSPALPWSRPLTRSAALLLAIGLLGLMFHCGAMFFRSTVVRLPGSTAAVDQINAMGWASEIWFVVPAGLVLVGLRRQFRPALAAATLTLAGVGVTMYDNGSRDIHLAAIFAAVVTLAATLSLLVTSVTSSDRPATPT